MESRPVLAKGTFKLTVFSAWSAFTNEVAWPMLLFHLHLRSNVTFTQVLNCALPFLRAIPDIPFPALLFTLAVVCITV